MEFGAGLRTMRALRGLSQKELQGLTGIDARYLSEIENGKIFPNADWATRIRLALNWIPEMDQDLERLGRVPE